MSTKAGVARPVRNPRSSSRNTLTAFSMRSSASKRISSLVIILPSPGVATRGLVLLRFTHQSANRFTRHGALDVAFTFEVENQDRHFALAAQADGRHVHDS